jgi:DNA-binding transcriptional ArsR family regulator
MEEHAKQLAELLKLMANENRLLILCALAKEPMTVTKLAEYVPDISQPALSQHLQLLRTAGILSFDKAAQSVTYSLADERIGAVMDVLKKNYCGDN